LTIAISFSDIVVYLDPMDPLDPGRPCRQLAGSAPAPNSLKGTTIPSPPTHSGAVPVAELDLPEFDNGSAAYEQDPYGVIEDLRSQGWLTRSRYGYTVLSYPKAREIKKSTEFVRIFDAITREQSEYLHKKASQSVSAQSGPTLVHLRRLMLQSLRPRMVDSIQHQMGGIFNDLLDDLSVLDSPDLIRDAVEPYPGLVMGPILGVPFAEAKELDRWASTINILGNHAAYATKLEAIEDAYRNMEVYLLEVIADRRLHPTDDILGDLVASATSDPEITDDQLLMLAHSIVNASIDNVRNQLALTIEALVQYPAQWRALQTTPDLVPAAVEEGLRYVPAGDDIQHRVPNGTVFHDVYFPKDTLIFINKKAVNRDGDSLDDPHAFRIDRESSPHLTFGFGLHSCVGATLARAAIGEAILALTERVEEWELSGEPERGPMASGGAARLLPVKLSLRERSDTRPQILQSRKHVDAPGR
jgi:cytochrome P450